MGWTGGRWKCLINCATLGDEAWAGALAAAISLLAVVVVMTGVEVARLLTAVEEMEVAVSGTTEEAESRSEVGAVTETSGAIIAEVDAEEVAEVIGWEVQRLRT